MTNAQQVHLRGAPPCHARMQTLHTGSCDKRASRPTCAALPHVAPACNPALRVSRQLRSRPACMRSQCGSQPDIMWCGHGQQARLRHPLLTLQTVVRQNACCKRMYCADQFRHNKAVRHQGPLFLRLASQRPRTLQSCAHQHALAGVAGQRADGHVGQPRLHAAGVCVRALLNLAPAARRACVAPLAQSGESAETPRTFCSQASPHGCRGVHDGRNAARTGAQGLSRRVAQGLR